MLDIIDKCETYVDDDGIVIIIGFIQHYVVYRRPRKKAEVCTLNEFAMKFNRL